MPNVRVIKRRLANSTAALWLWVAALILLPLIIGTFVAVFLSGYVGWV